MPSATTVLGSRMRLEFGLDVASMAQQFYKTMYIVRNLATSLAPVFNLIRRSDDAIVGD